MSYSTAGRKVVLNAFRAKQVEQMQKYARKGKLPQMVEKNEYRAQKLVEILKDPNPKPSISRESMHEREPTKDKTHRPMSDEEYLRTFNECKKQGRTFSTAPGRAHYLTKFLDEFVKSALSAGDLRAPLDPSDKFTFEVSRVEMMPDNCLMRVYWFTSGDERLDALVEKSLELHFKSDLRHLMSVRRVLAFVPPIQMVRDNSKALANKIDRHISEIKLSGDGDAKCTHDEINLERMSELKGAEFSEAMTQLRSNASAAVAASAPAQKVDELSVVEDAKTTLARMKKEMNEAKMQRLQVASQINRRTKYEKLSKSTLLKIGLLDFYSSSYKDNSD